MSSEKPTIVTAEFTQRTMPHREAAATLGLMAIALTNIGVGVVAIREQSHEQPAACTEQACGQLALQELLSAAIPAPSLPASKVKVSTEASKQPKQAEAPQPSAKPSSKPTPKPSPTDIPRVKVSEEGGDISFPQCRLVTDPKTKKRHWTYVAPNHVDFAVVGLTDYKRKDHINPCLTEELKWGLKVGLRGVYANVRNPGSHLDPEAYGRSQAEYTVQKFMAAMKRAGGNPDPTKYKWWLDIEGGNDWDEGNPLANRAVTEGWAEDLTIRKITFGLYSTNYMLHKLIGTIDPIRTPHLARKESWIPAAPCSEPPLPTSPRVAMVQTQRVQNGTTFDVNQTCLAR